jgi:hypothetical protein
MNREDIIRMAREAGAMFDHMTWVERDLAPVFERFAALVAAAEREACAEVCEAEAEKWEGNDGPICYEARLCAVNIRARGEK